MMQKAGEVFADKHLMAGALSEVHDASGVVHPEYERCLSVVAKMNRQQLAQRQQRLDRAAYELGLHFSATGEEDRKGPDRQLDLLPRIIRPDDWEHISEGVSQRVRAFDAYVSDLHGPQRILTDGVIPFAIPLSDKMFYRELTNLPAHKRFITLGAVDLVQTEDHKWYVSENHFSFPAGLAYILQNRRMMAQCLPDLFQDLQVEPVASFSTRLAELLSEGSSSQKSYIVMLTKGEHHASYFEDSFLARHMGLPMVKPADLLVREGKAYIKTIKGLEQVDVIFRRMESASLDPIAFGHDVFDGVPGLINCVRKGTVSIVNAPGCGVADNRAILRYSDRIIRYYLNELPILPTLKTFTCIDTDQAEHVVQEFDSMVVKPVNDRLFPTSTLEEKGKMLRGEALKRLLLRQPHHFVAQPKVDITTVPYYTNKSFEDRSVNLRCFVLNSKTPYVLPGGLTWQTSGTGKQMRGSEKFKDTWVVRRLKKRTGTRKERLERELAPAGFHISSRVAESLYWMGRYLERAENTARMLNVLENVRYDELNTEDRKLYWPLFKAVASATGHSMAEKKNPPRDTTGMIQALVLDRRDPSSIISCVQAAYNNSEVIREFVSPELWKALNLLRLRLREAHADKVDIRDLCDTVVNDVARILGVGIRTMQHDEGWQFFIIGSLLERSIAITTVLEGTLDRAASAQLKHLENDTDLTALLRLLGSLDAYRRTYRSRAYVDRVARLMWQSTTSPSSVAYCLKHLRGAIAGVAGSEGLIRANPLLERLDGLSQHLTSIPFHTIFPARVIDLDRGITPRSLHVKQTMAKVKEESVFLKNAVEQIHQHLEDIFFSHQHMLVEQEQLELKIVEGEQEA